MYCLLFSNLLKRYNRSTELEQGEDHDHAIVSIFVPKVVEDDEEDTSAPEAPDAPESEQGGDEADAES